MVETTQYPTPDGAREHESASHQMVRAAPRWLRDLGFTSWLLVGVTLLLVGAVWLLALTQTIVMPLIAAGVIAAVASPVVAWLKGHGVPRALGAVLLLLALVLVGALVVVVIVGGVSSESASLSKHISSAETTVQGWLKDLGIDPKSASSATSDAHSATASIGQALLHGVTVGVEKLSSLAFFLALTLLSLVFLLKDGPTIRAWAERHAGVPVEIAHTVSGRILQSLRGYFFGVTIVAVFNAVVVGVGALILGIPLAGTIAVVTFVGAYIPYLGAWTAGAFAVLLALGGAGEEAALGMIVIQLLANGVLQQLVQPIAYGAALGIHPLAVLVVTIAGGALFGAAGLILAAPMTSAISRIVGDLRGESQTVEGGPEPANPMPGAAAPAPAG
ncbi:MAG: AI-2E family transporter [Solirubrobacteraceae bacterium]